MYREKERSSVVIISNLKQVFMDFISVAFFFDLHTHTNTQTKYTLISLNDPRTDVFNLI